MTRPKLIIQKCDLISIIVRDLPRLPAADRERFHAVSLGDQVEIVFIDDPDKLAIEIVNATFLITENRPVTAELIRNAKELKLIQNGCLRHNAIDCVAARQAGIPVSAIAQPGDVFVAEHVLMLMMALGKNLLLADQAVRRGEWRHVLAPHVTSTTQSPLFNKTLGIIGLGEIGSLVANKARCLGMRVIYYNHRRYSVEEEQEMNVEYRPLSGLMRDADYVSIHIALTPDTVGFIGKRELSAMKPSAFLINTARGAVIDPVALFDALNTQAIRGAGLDVFVDEPLPTTNPLTQLNNVILTPHVAGVGVAWDSLQTLFCNVKHVLREEPLEHVIN